MARRRQGRPRDVPRRNRAGGYFGWEGQLVTDGRSGFVYPEALAVRQCGSWRTRHERLGGTWDETDPVDDPCPAGDSPVTLSVAATDSAATEAGGTGTFTITRTGSASAVLPVYFGLSGTATLGVDYTASASSPVTLAAGSATVTVTITPIADAAGEGSETVVLALLMPTKTPLSNLDPDARSATVTIAE